jgi:hypothetical protein
VVVRQVWFIRVILDVAVMEALRALELVQKKAKRFLRAASKFYR